MSLFEAGMLICFGLAWPVSIYKSYSSGQIAGKSIRFLYVVFLGYILGTIHKVLYNFDTVTILYVANGLMVFIDIVLYKRNERRLAQKG